MASKAFAGVGTEFFYFDHGVTPSGWQKLVEVKKISGPNKKRDTADVTNMDSLDGYKEFIATFRDAGEVSLDMNFTRDSFEVANELFESDDRQAFQIIFSDIEKSTFYFEGFVTGLDMDASTTEAVTSKMTIKISGKPTLDSGSVSASPSGLDL